MKNKIKLKKVQSYNTGITLIALVITIVVLIILAGITIASVTGEKGIIKEARTAKELSEKAALEELVELSIIKAEQKHRNPTIDNVIEELKNNKVISKDNQIDKETGSIITDAGYEITGKLDDYIGKISIGDGNTSGGDGNTSQGGETEEPPKLTLPNTDDTKPYLPDDKSEIISNNPDTGIIIKDGLGDEWVWIEVPISVFPEGLLKEDYVGIAAALEAYTSHLRRVTLRDVFGSYKQHGFANESEYNAFYRSMLTSVFEHGGFWVSRFEAGSPVPKLGSGDPVGGVQFRRDLYPILVTSFEAQNLMRTMPSRGCTKSLMFGIQYDLVLRFVEAKGAASLEELKRDAGTWGNYKNVEFRCK